MENKYKPGNVVFAIAKPEVILVVRRYFDRIYYCQAQNGKSDKDLVFFEKELKSSKE